MSLIASNCHGYSATGISGWPATPTKVWALGWFKVDATTAGAYRAIVQVSDDTLDSTHDYFDVMIDGSNVLTASCRTGNANAATPDPGNWYFWSGGQQNKWALGCVALDLDASAADLNCIFGRYEATAKSATTQTAASDRAAFADTLVNIYVANDHRKVSSGTTTTNDDTDGMKVAYIAIGHGSVPSQADIQDCIDGQHPADLAGIFEYWDLTSSGAGLVGALRSITLAPFGGSATTTWDGGDNPTVSAPSGGGGGGSIPAISRHYNQLRRIS